MHKAAIILASTRQGRRGEKVARWVLQHASSRTDLAFELIDLRDWPLPFFDRPITPSGAKGDYGLDLANRWSAKIREFQGFVIVTPEYNHGYPGVLKNALDWLYSEWNRKPVAFVGYSNGPISGARSVEQLREVVIALEMIPLRRDVLLPAVAKLFSESGEMLDPSYNTRLSGMLNQVAEYVTIFAPK